jgi:hypothetical protein
MTFAHEIIDTSNNFMLIEKYEIMLVIDRINEKIEECSSTISFMCHLLTLF